MAQVWVPGSQRKSLGIQNDKIILYLSLRGKFNVHKSAVIEDLLPHISLFPQQSDRCSRVRHTIGGNCYQ